MHNIQYIPGVKHCLPEQEVAEVDLQYPPLPEYNHHGPTRLAHILIYMELAFFKTENIAKEIRNVNAPNYFSVFLNRQFNLFQIAPTYTFIVHDPLQCIDMDPVLAKNRIQGLVPQMMEDF